MPEETEVPVPQQSDTIGAELPGLGAAETTETTEQPKKRRKRGPNKRKPATVEEVAPDASEEEKNLGQAMAMGFDFGGRIAASMRGDHWLFKPEETQMLGQAWAKALHPYMANVAPYMPFVVATIVTAGVMMPKIQEDRRIAAARQLGAAGPIRIEPRQVPSEPIATTREDGAYSREHIAEVAPADNRPPEMRPQEPMPGTIGAAARSNRKRRNATEDFPPGVS